MEVKSTNSPAFKARPEDILEHLFRPMGVPGVYARTGAYEDVVDALGRFFTRFRPGSAMVFRFPPVVSRADVEKAGYLKSFPHLLGCVCGLGADEGKVSAAVGKFLAGGEWTDDVEATDLVLAPAACYPSYAIAAGLGPAPREGFIFDIFGDCFRREPSRDIDRLQSFRLREFVAIGDNETVLSFRAHWLSRASEIASLLGLSHRVEVGSDPFFGRAGGVLSRIQLDQSLKFELLVPVRSREVWTACASFNYHRQHFGEAFGIVSADGQTAHSACVGFGIDRLALALFATHGLDPKSWPNEVLSELGI